MRGAQVERSSAVPGATAPVRMYRGRPGRRRAARGRCANGRLVAAQVGGIPELRRLGTISYHVADTEGEYQSHREGQTVGLRHGGFAHARPSAETGTEGLAAKPQTTRGASEPEYCHHTQATRNDSRFVQISLLSRRGIRVAPLGKQLNLCTQVEVRITRCHRLARACDIVVELLPEREAWVLASSWLGPNDRAPEWCFREKHIRSTRRRSNAITSVARHSAAKAICAGRPPSDRPSHARGPQGDQGARESYGGTHLLIGGPPCQGFSNANRNSWHGDNPHNGLVGCVSSYVESLQPLMFLMENVQGHSLDASERQVRGG